ncbi:MAG: thiamine-phosphate kinase [Methanomethylovorans sp.]|jgi:thiamine-monophosphate kinase|nr:thiamine-phosphate kinase [Methanomethylovorans sp.]
MKYIPVSQIGERSLISLLSNVFRELPDDIIIGAGADDCAVIDINESSYLVVTTDMLHRITDFPEQMSAWQIGWMSAAVNLSDIAAMGARPIGLLASLGIPLNTDVFFVEEIARGMKDCAREYDTAVIGGDIDSHDELTICGSALGTVPKGQLLTRKGAHVGDKVCVTGYAGSAGAALYALENDMDVPNSVLKALFEPIPRIKEAMKLAATGHVTSMMDTSDGIAMSLYDLSNASGVGFILQEKALPLQPEVEELMSFNRVNLNYMALYTGGDFELIFTVRPEGIEEVLNMGNISMIGEVLPHDRSILIQKLDGTVLQVERKGYEQLKIAR